MKLLGAAFAVTATALCAVPVLSDHPAMASCAAPTVKFKPTRVARGGVLTITGQYFGDDCLDTGTATPGSGPPGSGPPGSGPPGSGPPGVGPLGSPLAGLAIVIDQGEREFLVATGSADNDYEFQVDVVVPAELEPGEASLNIIGAGDARLTITPALVISNAPPVDTVETAVATFGPEPTTDTEPPGSVAPPILPADIPDEPLDTAPPLSTVPIEEDSDDSGVQRAISVGVAGVVAIGALGFALWGRSRRRS